MQLDDADDARGIERVLKAHAEGLAAVVAKVAAGVDEAALAGGADVEQDGPVGDDGGSVALYVGPRRSLLVLAMAYGSCGWGQRVSIIPFQTRRAAS